MPVLPGRPHSRRPRRSARTGAGVTARRTYAAALAEQRAHRALAELEVEYRAGRARVFPDRITAALDIHGLHGPEVDRACGAEEPAVDRWEAGEAAPTWEQLVALAALTGHVVAFFTREFVAPPGPVFVSGPGGCVRMPARVRPAPYRPPATVRPL
jgi:hypothetical protein